ncbi:HAMP domain-containing histidine kinase [Streptomyces sp. NBC_01356]|uniref:sensor histidine kinase n=1 Tax=Streptomyces sp. NBC_01356 TaxID=2903836 RepID=UPI002E32B4A5|nr:HAMP domain-containing sensor histidine kinase [Streptomyces sp. NBC_01356]
MSDDPDIAASLPTSPSTVVENEQLAQAIGQLHAAKRRFRDETMDSLLTHGGIALVAVGILAGGFGWMTAGRALRPLHRITETAQEIAGADGTQRGLHERIALTGPYDEVKRLADTFDVMLEKLDRSFDGQRRFVANASHELRTLLALNRALVELAVTRPGAAVSTKQLGESLLTVNQRHEQLIDGLLVLADAENELAERSPADLADIARHVLHQTEAAKTPGPDVRSTLHPAPVRGDPILLERLVQNLVENAVRHNTADGWVAVATGTESGRAVLTVSNTGPVVPPHETEALFQPFRRLHRDRLDGGRGSGLGLSIVRAIAHAHGGDAGATPREGGGLTVSVGFPPGSEPAHAGPHVSLPVADG